MPGESPLTQRESEHDDLTCSRRWGHTVSAARSIGATWFIAVNGMRLELLVERLQVHAPAS